MSYARVPSVDDDLDHIEHNPNPYDSRRNSVESSQQPHHQPQQQWQPPSQFAPGYPPLGPSPYSAPGAPAPRPVPQRAPDLVLRPGVVIPSIPDRAALKERIATRHVQPDVSLYISDGWKMLKANFSKYLAMQLIILVVVVGIVLGTLGGSMVAGRKHPGPVEGIIILALLLIFVWPLPYGILHATFEGMRTDGRVKVSDMFYMYKWSYYWRFQLFSLVRFSIAWVLDLVFIPGLIFRVATVFSFPLHLDHSPWVGIFETFKLSGRVVSKYICPVVLYILFTIAAIIVGFLCFGVGVFVAFPLVITTGAFFYHHVIGVNGCPLAPSDVYIASHPHPQAHPQAYPHASPQANSQAPHVVYAAPPVAASQQQAVYPVAPMAGAYHPQGAVYHQGQFAHAQFGSSQHHASQPQQHSASQPSSHYPSYSQNVAPGVHSRYPSQPSSHAPGYVAYAPQTPQNSQQPQMQRMHSAPVVRMGGPPVSVYPQVAAARPVPDVNDSVQRLMALGFSEQQSRAALASNNNDPDRAASALLA